MVRFICYRAVGDGITYPSGPGKETLWLSNNEEEWTWSSIRSRTTFIWKSTGGTIAPAIPGQGNSTNFFEGEVRALYLGDSKPGGGNTVAINVINWVVV